MRTWTRLTATAVPTPDDDRHDMEEATPPYVGSALATPQYLTPAKSPKQPKHLKQPKTTKHTQPEAPEVTEAPQGLKSPKSLKS